MVEKSFLHSAFETRTKVFKGQSAGDAMPSHDLAKLCHARGGWYVCVCAGGGRREEVRGCKIGAEKGKERQCSWVMLQRFVLIGRKEGRVEESKGVLIFFFFYLSLSHLHLKNIVIFRCETSLSLASTPLLPPPPPPSSLPTKHYSWKHK